MELITVFKWWDSCGAFIASSYSYKNRLKQTLSDYYRVNSWYFKQKSYSVKQGLTIVEVFNNISTSGKTKTRKQTSKKPLYIISTLFSCLQHFTKEINPFRKLSEKSYCKIQKVKNAVECSWEISSYVCRLLVVLCLIITSTFYWMKTITSYKVHQSENKQNPHTTNLCFFNGIWIFAEKSLHDQKTRTEF